MGVRPPHLQIMAAFNELVATAKCPACGATCVLRFQVHLWASFGGDETGRFHRRTYELGQPFRWWAEADRRYSESHEAIDWAPPGAGADLAERCYGKCECCATELLGTVSFRSQTATMVSAVEIDRGQD